MPLVRTRDVYHRAREGGYAVGGFCAENLEMIQAIIGAAEETRSPVVLMLWQEDILAAGPGFLEAIVRYAAQRSSAPVSLMADHASSLAFCLTCMINGHSGVMIDGSHLPLTENIDLTRQVCQMAHTVDVLVEGELGTVRRTFEQTGPYSEDTVLTDPDEVAQFVTETGVDSLAVSIGTESGICDHEPQLDFDRLRQIARASGAYVVLHGGSGTPHDTVRELVREGITAMRFASAMRLAYLDVIEEKRATLGRNYPDTRQIFGPARDRVRGIVVEYMQSLGCAGQADGW